MKAAILATTLHAHDVTSPAGWVAYGAAFAVLVAFVVAGPLLAVWVVERWRPGGSDSDEDSGRGGGGGGGRDPDPPNDPPASDPEWWPDFERQFEAHVSSLLTPAG